MEHQHSPEQIRTASGILAILYGIIGIFPVFWGFPFSTSSDQLYILMFFNPFLFMSISMFLITRMETGMMVGLIIGLDILACAIGLIVIEELWINALILLVYGMLYGSYYLRAYSFGTVHDARFRGWDSIIEATQPKVIYMPFLLLFLLILSLGSQ